MGRHRLVAARSSRALRPSRAGRHTRHLRLPARFRRPRRMETCDAPGIAWSLGPRLAKPVSLLNGITGRRQPAGERPWLRVGGLMPGRDVAGGRENRSTIFSWSQQEIRRNTNYSYSPDLLFTTQRPL